MIEKDSSDGPYRLLDSGEGCKLEAFGRFSLIRPCGQAVWRRSQPKLWEKYAARFTRESGSGCWEVADRRLPKEWIVSIGALRLAVQRTDFGHVGVFPEHQVNWRTIERTIREGSGRPPARVLNLFAYTGAATVAASLAGAEVVHVDASKTSVDWARRNAELSGTGDRPIRWIVDDVFKFLQREERRGTRYDGVILDPPSFGRGPKGQMWKIEDSIVDLLGMVRKVLTPTPRFVMLSSHSQGFTPIVLNNLLADSCAGLAGEVSAHEMTLEEPGGKRMLPAGANAVFLGIAP